MSLSTNSILRNSGSVGSIPRATGRPSYHPSVPLKLYIYGYLNRVQSSRRLEREASRNVEVMWLTGRLVPDHKTIADFRKDNGPAIRKVCAQFVALCREMGLLTKASVAIDGSSSKRSTTATRISRRAKMERRLRSNRGERGTVSEPARHPPTCRSHRKALASKTAHLKEKLAKLASEVQRLKAIEKEMLASPDRQISLTDPDSRSMGDERERLGRRRRTTVQVAVDTEHHLIVTHEVTNTGSDRAQLAATSHRRRRRSWC